MKKKNFVLILALLSVSICCFSSWQRIERGCFWWKCPPHRNFSVLDWEVPDYLFPEDSIIGNVTLPSEGRPYIEEGNQDVWIGNNGAGAIYIVYRFPTFKKSVSDFKRLNQRMYDPGSGERWQTPDDINFHSATADEQYIACGLFFDTNRCKAVIRYQEYVIFFNSDITDEMTFARYEEVLFYLDEQISSRLYP